MSGRLYDAYDSVMKMKCLQCHQQYLNVSTPPSLLLKIIKKPSSSPEQSKLDFSRTLHPAPVDNIDSDSEELLDVFKSTHLLYTFAFSHIHQDVQE